TNNSFAATTIYRLNFPPAGMQPNIVNFSKKPVTLYSVVAIILVILFAGTTWILFVRKRKKTTAVRVQDEISESVKFERTRKNAIWLLNEFKVFDQNGHDISYRFATKIRHAFIVLFFENYFNNGITSDDFSDLLWPSLNKNQQKNNRGVIMNNLRKIFEDLPLINLIKENQRWKLKFENGLYIDFIEVHNVLVMAGTDENNEAILNYFSIGNLLSNENWEYLDQYKERYSSAAIDVLLHMNKNAYQKHNHLKCIEISDIILNYFDFLNEPALIYKIKSLYILKNSSRAVSEYNKFRLRYNESISKPFHLSFDDILKTTVPPENY
ncbi:MAG TPA: hypothetical protein VHI78_12895, partial [Bacteroidales bacterium]|nr:hypothetical protein [Bacteroidales bacterium]